MVLHVLQFRVRQHRILPVPEQHVHVLYHMFGLALLLIVVLVPQIMLRFLQFAV